MIKTSAVSERANIWNPGLIKNSILAFDKIYVPWDDDNLKLLESDLFGTDVSLDDVMYLREKRVIFDNPVDQSQLIRDASAKLNEYLATLEYDLGNESKQNAFGFFLERCGAAKISSSMDELTTPVSAYAPEWGGGMQPDKDVMSLVLDNFPSVHEDVPYDEVLGFREENDFLYKELLLWIRKASREERLEEDLRDEILHLINQFSRAKEIADIKFRAGRAEIFFLAMGAIKDFLSLKPEKVRNTIAHFRKNRANLMQAEMDNPGRPLGFVVKAKEKFE